MSTTFQCQSGYHEGSRLVLNPLDRYSKRVAYRRLDGQRRLYERTVMFLCRSCVEAESVGKSSLNEGMFG